jgi:hypothetical protein
MLVISYYPQLTNIAGESLQSVSLASDAFAKVF